MTRSVACLLLGLPWLLLCGCGAGLGAGEPAVLKADLPVGDSMTPVEAAFAQQVYHLLNLERVRAGVQPLEWSDVAAEVAYDHCVDMHLRSYYDHRSPEGTTPCDRMEATGLRLAVCGGENIARGNRTAAEVMAVWMASPPHRANILEPLYTHVGVGVHAGSEGPWWVQEFFTPLER